MSVGREVGKVIGERVGDDGAEGECGRLRDLGVRLSVTIRELEEWEITRCQSSYSYVKVQHPE